MSALHQALLATALFVSACSGGGASGGSSSGSSSSSSGSGGATILSGVYNGRISNGTTYLAPYDIYLDSAGNAEIVRIQMDSDNTAFSVTRVNGPIFSGSGSYSAISYAVNSNHLDNDGTVENITLQLTGTQGGSITGSYSGSGVGYNSISTDYGVYSGTPTTLATLAGSYAFGYYLGGQNYTGTVIITSTGIVSGTDSGGCSYSGTVGAQAADNVFDLSFSSSCLSTALSGVLFAPPGSNQVNLAVNNSSGALYAVLTKQAT
ncbi:MAG TPA: hypothetical protein VFA75_07005 [Nevskia sp.]|nr:hypothetical protein [Nevskia sp.]